MSEDNQDVVVPELASELAEDVGIDINAALSGFNQNSSPQSDVDYQAVGEDQYFDGSVEDNEALLENISSADEIQPNQQTEVQDQEFEGEQNEQDAPEDEQEISEDSKVSLHNGRPVVDVKALFEKHAPAYTGMFAPPKANSLQSPVTLSMNPLSMNPAPLVHNALSPKVSNALSESTDNLAPSSSTIDDDEVELGSDVASALGAVDMYEKEHSMENSPVSQKTSVSNTPTSPRSSSPVLKESKSEGKHGNESNQNKPGEWSILSEEPLCIIDQKSTMFASSDKPTQEFEGDDEPETLKSHSITGQSVEEVLRGGNGKPTPVSRKPVPPVFPSKTSKPQGKQAGRVNFVSDNSSVPEEPVFYSEQIWDDKEEWESDRERLAPLIRKTHNNLPEKVKQSGDCKSYTQPQYPQFAGRQINPAECPRQQPYLPQSYQAHQGQYTHPDPSQYPPCPYKQQQQQQQYAPQPRCPYGYDRYPNYGLSSQTPDYFYIPPPPISSYNPMGYYAPNPTGVYPANYSTPYPAMFNPHASNYPTSHPQYPNQYHPSNSYNAVHPPVGYNHGNNNQPFRIPGRKSDRVINITNNFNQFDY